MLAGGDWTNPNVMEGKSKTFVRGFVPNLTHRPTHRRPKKKANKNSKLEAEALARGAPPEALAVGAEESAEEPQPEPWDGIEYDD